MLRFIVFSCVFVAGCAGAIASSGQSKSAAASIAILRGIEQAALLGAYSTPRSFDLVAPDYVRALSGFRAATPAADDARAQETEGLRRAFGNCIEAVELLARTHRTSGLSDDPTDFLAIEVCQSAKDALERSR